MTQRRDREEFANGVKKVIERRRFVKPGLKKRITNLLTLFGNK
jgi:hypothetical protein